MPDSPLVSVVIPAYNADEFIREAVESVLAQDYRPLEILVVDDASTDTTVEVLRSLASNLPTGIQMRIHELEANGGAAHALAEGFECARGAFICWLSADDAYVARDKLSRQVELMVTRGTEISYFRSFAQGPGPDAATAVDARFLRRFRFLERWVEQSAQARLFMLLFSNPINGSSVMIRRDCLDRFGTFDGLLRNVDPDGDLWMRYSALGAKFGVLDGESVFYRVHPAQTSQATRKMRVGTAVSRLRMLQLLRSSRMIHRSIGAGWVLLPLILRWETYRGMPEVAWSVGNLLAENAESSFLARFAGRALMRRLDAEALVDAGILEEAGQGARTLARSPEFEQFGQFLKGR